MYALIMEQYIERTTNDDTRKRSRIFSTFGYTRCPGEYQIVIFVTNLLFYIDVLPFMKATLILSDNKQIQ